MVASDDSAMRLAAKLGRQPPLVLCGYIGFGGKDAQPGPRPAVPGSLDQIGDLIEKYQLSRIVCQDEVRNREQLVRCHVADASFDLVPDFFQSILTPTRILGSSQSRFLPTLATGVVYCPGCPGQRPVCRLRMG